MADMDQQERLRKRRGRRRLGPCPQKGTDYPQGHMIGHVFCKDCLKQTEMTAATEHCLDRARQALPTGDI